MKLIDTHTHLYIEDFDQDRKEQIELAIKNGVHKFYYLLLIKVTLVKC